MRTSTGWIELGSFPGRYSIDDRKQTDCGLFSKVCKTFIRRFDSDPRLQYPHRFLSLPVIYTLLILASACAFLWRIAGECWIRFGSRNTTQHSDAIGRRRDTVSRGASCAVPAYDLSQQSPLLQGTRDRAASRPAIGVHGGKGRNLAAAPKNRGI